MSDQRVKELEMALEHARTERNDYRKALESIEDGPSNFMHVQTAKEALNKWR